VDMTPVVEHISSDSDMVDVVEKAPPAAVQRKAGTGEKALEYLTRVVGRARAYLMGWH